MGTVVDFRLKKIELAIEYLPSVGRNPQDTPTESDVRFVTDQIAKTNEIILIDADKAVETIEDESFNNPDLSKSSDTITLTRQQLRGLLSRSALAGVSVTAERIGTAMMKKEQTSHLLDLDPLDPLGA